MTAFDGSWWPVVIALTVAIVVLYTGSITVDKITDPEYMCESKYGEGWDVAENVTTVENGVACQAPNGTVRTFVIEYLRNGASVREAP